MARELSDQERQRMERGGAWLRQERERRGFATGTAFATALGIKQVRLSTYERGLNQIPEDVVHKIAEVLGLDEPTLWRRLELPLPRPFRTDEAAFAYYSAKYPNVFAGALDDLPPPDGDPGANRRRPGVRPPPVPHKGDEEDEPSHRRASSH